MYFICEIVPQHKRLLHIKHISSTWSARPLQNEGLRSGHIYWILPNTSIGIQTGREPCRGGGGGGGGSINTCLPPDVDVWKPTEFVKGIIHQMEERLSPWECYTRLQWICDVLWIIIIKTNMPFPPTETGNFLPPLVSCSHRHKHIHEGAMWG